MARLVESKVTKLEAPKAIEHNLPPYLASDEALIHALNRYPAGLVDTNGQGLPRLRRDRPRRRRRRP